eukprot:GGOE01013273.1.p2 GENE.GGOE01013273.1~~GGOE01013273.1.p2  ORF type:complete len:111 (+),score=7.64 GGOE01013273.1:1245-1577(+)
MEVMEPDSSLTLSISNCGHGFLYATLVHAGTSHNSGSRAPFHLFPCTLGIPCPLGLHPFFPSLTFAKPICLLGVIYLAARAVLLQHLTIAGVSLLPIQALRPSPRVIVAR